ncbi:hypothetical protein ACFPZL_02160 [Leucobacter soli]|uniref:Uncharacterized protein n=1 Tax=Leucobacter soli TaxID=2812850 RepID=A0A916JT00_9MICO|nr:hypothetical protein [Leucobacter soli]CAG7600901.1 hypothetical protein LEUCIP111803_00410 [Leucobacter soli]
MKSQQPAGIPGPDPAYRRHRRLVRLGQLLMLLGAVILIVHWLAHLETFGPTQPEGWIDLVAGYPMGGLFLLGGGILAGRRAA